MMYTPPLICCPACKEQAPLAQLACTCPKCDMDFTPFLTFGACTNCSWTAGRLRCRACGKKNDLVEWLETGSGEKSMFQFFRSLLEMRESICSKKEQPEQPDSSDLSLGFRRATILTITASFRQRGKMKEKTVKVEDSHNILMRMFTEGLEKENWTEIVDREWYVERKDFDTIVTRLTRDLRLYHRIQPLLKGATIRLNQLTVRNLPNQVRALRRFQESIRGKAACLYFSIHMETGPISRPPAKPVIEEPAEKSGGHVFNFPSDTESWSDAMVLGCEKLLDFFEAIARDEADGGTLVVRTSESVSCREFLSNFRTSDIPECTPFMISLFEEQEDYEACARIQELLSRLGQIS